jgi:hypothetical protein
VRNSAAAPGAVVLLAPEENSALSRAAADIRWREVPGALYYQVFVLSEDGDVVWQRQEAGTSLRLPDDHPLRAGTNYFVRVRGYLSGGGTVSSTAVSFHFVDR